jgi:hypothetical protein
VLLLVQLDEADRLMLAKLRGVMGISQFEGERAIEAVTAPVYRDNLAQAFIEVQQTNTITTTYITILLLLLLSINLYHISHVIALL